MATNLRTCRVDVSDESKKYTDEMNSEIYNLAGMVVEMFEENKVMLLSPLFREMIINKAKLVQELHGKVSNRIYIDALNGVI